MCRNIDTLDFNAHLALLAATMTHLIQLPESAWRADMIRSIVDTVRGIYFGRQSIQAFIEALKATPGLAMVTMHPDLPTTCESISKAILLAICIREELDAAGKRDIILRVLAEAIGREISGDAITDRYGLDGHLPIPDELDVGVEDLGLGHPDTYYTQGDMERETKQKLYELKPAGLDVAEVKFRAKNVKIKAASNVQHFADFLWGETFRAKEQCPQYSAASFVVHACQHPKSIDRARHPLPEAREANDAIVTALVNHELRDLKKKVRPSLWRAMNCFRRRFQPVAVAMAQNRAPPRMPASWDMLTMPIDLSGTFPSLVFNELVGKIYCRLLQRILCRYQTVNMHQHGMLCFMYSIT